MFELVWCGEDAFKKLGFIDADRYSIMYHLMNKSSADEELYDEVIISDGKTEFKFTPSVYDDEENEYEYDYLKVIATKYVENDNEKAEQQANCMFVFNNRFIEDIRFETLGKYNHSENHVPEVQLNYMKNTKLVCVAVSIPSLNIVISLKKYRYCVAVQEIDSATDWNYAFKLSLK